MVNALLRLSKLSSNPRNLFFLFLLFSFFLITRLVLIQKVLPSLYWDEASIGYNAYSIARDLKDEWEEFLPLHFRAFGEFKLPVYIYATAVSVKLLGLNELAVRLPAVLFSLLIVIFTYLIARKLTKSNLPAILSAFFLTVSPWFFIFSRTGYEMTSGLAFFMAAIYLFLDKTRAKYLLGVICLVITIYSYNSFRIISPLVFTIFSANFVYKNKGNLKVVIAAAIIMAISLIPVIRLFIYDAGFGRASGISLIPSIAQVYDLEGKPHLQVIFRSANTDLITNVGTVFTNYLKHFSPDFLFGGDKNPRSQIPGFGQINILDIPLFILGAYCLLKLKGRFVLSKERVLILFLFLLGFVPAALFKESPHALRSLTAVPFLVIITSIGVYCALQKFPKYKNIILPILVIWYLLSFENYFGEFITSYTAKSSRDWQYGYSQVFTKYVDEFGKYNKIIVSDEYAQPYIFALYNLKIDPEVFRREVKLNSADNWGFSTVSGFGKFEFRKIRTEDYKKGNLVFASPVDVLPQSKESSEIFDLDGSLSLRVYENK